MKNQNCFLDRQVVEVKWPD